MTMPLGLRTRAPDNTATLRATTTTNDPAGWGTVPIMTPGYPSLRPVQESVRPGRRPGVVVAVVVAVVVGTLALVTAAMFAALALFTSDPSAERAAVAYVEERSGRRGAVVEGGWVWDDCAVFNVFLAGDQTGVIARKVGNTWVVRRGEIGRDREVDSDDVSDHGRCLDYARNAEE
jgi:hypothetical protein